MYDNNRSTDRRPPFRSDANPGEYTSDHARAPRTRTRIVRREPVSSSSYSRSDGMQDAPRPRFNSGDPRSPQRYSRGNGYSSRGEGYSRSEGYGQSDGYNIHTDGYSTRNEGYSRSAQPAQRRQRPQAQQQRAQHNSAVYSQRKRIEYKQRYEDPTKPIRLNKYLANAGFCSRREADDFIQAGVVTVNGVVVDSLGAKVLPTDKVMFHHQPVRRERKVYILLNKPKNCVTTTDDPEERRTVMDIVKNACSERIYPVGRLDRNTTGVLLLTNDGDLASKLTHPKFGKKKVYAVTLDHELEEADEAIIRAGIMLDDEKIVPDALEFTGTDRKRIGLEIHSGQNRVVRRIFEKVGYKVTVLDRVSFAGLTKKNVPRGKYRFLTEREVSMLQMGAFE